MRRQVFRQATATLTRTNRIPKDGAVVEGVAYRSASVSETTNA